MATCARTFMRLSYASKNYILKNSTKNKYVGAWNFGPNKLNNLKVKEVVKVGKKFFNSKSKIIFKKKKILQVRKFIS